jgi:nucleotide-binding universal stress UspA family protein
LLTYYELDPRIPKAERAYLDRIVQRLAGTLGVPADSALLSGPIAQTLMEYSRSVAADLVVMTTHGRGPVSRFWLGSVADQLLRQMILPLVLVRPRETSTEGIISFPMRRVLIALDGSRLAEDIVEPALNLGYGMGAEYLLVRVVKPVPAIGSHFTGYTSVADQSQLPELEAEAQLYLDRVAVPLRERGFSVQTRVVINPLPAAALLDEAREQNCHLIALATHGRGGLQRMILGSVADKVLREALVPVLIQRPKR